MGPHNTVRSMQYFCLQAEKVFKREAKPPKGLFAIRKSRQVFEVCFGMGPRNAMHLMRPIRLQTRQRY